MINVERLSFLDEILDVRSNQYYKADFLKSDFHENSWFCKFGDHATFYIDFKINLSDGSSLTCSGNEYLLETLKLMLTVIVHPDSFNSGVMLSHKTMYVRVRMMLTIIDWLLINDTYIFLSDGGLKNISSDVLKGFLSQLSTSNIINTSIYEWENKLYSYIGNEVSKTDDKKLSKIISELPEISVIDNNQYQNNEYNLSDDFIRKARAWCILSGHYIYNGSQKHHYRYSIDTISLSEIIYKDTLRGRKTIKKIPTVLSYSATAYCRIEYPRIPVRNEELNVISKKIYRNYRSILVKVTLLHVLNNPNLQIPNEGTLSSICKYEPERSKNYDRYRTLPSDIVFGELRNAIEFHFEHGNTIINGFVNLVKKIHLTGAAITKMEKGDFQSYLTPELITLGVKKWSLSYERIGKWREHSSVDKNLFFYEFRTNVGFFEMLEVYYGCVQIVVGALMARRVGELVDISALNSIDDTNSFLLFFNRKSTINLYGLRNMEVRPIDPIAVEMLKNIKKIQCVLLDLGYIKSYTNFFSIPFSDNPLYLKQVTNLNYNNCLDRFCDYFETPTKSGKRYYFRQHQLRRFFAMLFFWGSSFGGLDTLRWFLGHSDPEHLYNYITEICPGSLLQSIKSQYVSESIGSYEHLAEFIKLHFDSDDFIILESDDLELYIQDLLEDGLIDIEPEFFVDENKNKYRIIVKIHEKH